MTTAKSASAANLEALKLSPNMLAALRATPPGSVMTPGPTRAALMRRDLVWSRSAVHRQIPGTLTPAGEVARAELLLADAAPEPAESPEPELPARKRGALASLSGALAGFTKTVIERGAELKLAQAALEDDREARTIIGAGSDRTPLVERPVPRVKLGDTVRIHRGTRLYEVKKLDRELIRDGHVIEVNALALLDPCDPGEGAPAQWVSVDMLHVVPPVAHLKTLPVGRGGVETLAEEPVVVSGIGWSRERGLVRQVGTVRGGASRLPYAALLPWPAESRVEWAAGCLRIGDSIVVDGRLWRVVWDGGPGEPTLRAENWHGFQDAPYQLR